ncbi:helix-turn-helix protein [Kineothrix alysoides]|uniref:Helix-turn-helix protein n=1 Tax=Kineothrix alysoides TaxID=1469948 RepID=A0A4R1QSU0_9FIRM|nr:helix-turn-helix domain-containing protein [Kineothrix alysoides]TCL56908.1 helix-turn-helix protein [Kineothrix alysoides]
MAASPLEYLNNARSMKACNLLRYTEESILSILENTGFHSVSSFNKYFYRVFQVSSREYLKQMKLTNAKPEKQSILEYAGWLYPEKTK